MKKTLEDKISDKLVNAFVNNKIISAIPNKFTRKLTQADKFRKLCEGKIKDPIIGFKAGGTGIPLMKKLKEKEPFVASFFSKNFIKSGKKVKINKSTLGIELEVCYLIKKSFFISKGQLTNKNLIKYISHMAPCIEVVGYRQKKKGITSFGDLCSDFGGNIKFLIGQKKRFKRINIGNLKTNITNKKAKQSVNGNTSAVYINPLNSLKFILKKVKKEKINLNNSKILFLGAAYKANIDDIRESPSIKIFKYFNQQKINFDYCDPYISKINIIDFYKKSVNLNYKYFKKYKVVILLTDHNAFDQKQIINNSKLIIDTRGFFQNFRSKKIYSI